jgi:hypothetical protein
MRIGLAVLSIIAFCANALFGFLAFAATAQMGGFIAPRPWWVAPAVATFVLIPIVQAVLAYRGRIYRLGQAEISACAWILGLFMISVLVEVCMVVSYRLT